jgi:plastocyanin domain-containing protein
MTEFQRGINTNALTQRAKYLKNMDDIKQKMDEHSLEADRFNTEHNEQVEQIQIKQRNANSYNEAEFLPLYNKFDKFHKQHGKKFIKLLSMYNKLEEKVTCLEERCNINFKEPY